MVSLEQENAYQLRQHLHSVAIDGARHDSFKSSFVSFLGLTVSQPVSSGSQSSSLYQRCAIAGLAPSSQAVGVQDLNRLLGQAAKIDSTPRPWVSDVFGVMCVKWLVEQMNDAHIAKQFDTWTSGFIPQQLGGSRFDPYERDIAAYISNSERAVFSTACIPLFLHYKGKVRIEDQKQRLSLIQAFMKEFQRQAREPSSTALTSVMVYVFDMLGHDIMFVPPNGWSLDDLMRFLQQIPVGLKRWTWEETGRTRNAQPIKWSVENEYHVQNLLYLLLAPVFSDISDEVYLKPVGQKTPRVDLYIPGLHVVVEVKYRKDTKKSFQMLIGEVAEDVSLYRADPTYKDARIITFLWDSTRATQEHSKFKEGVMKLQGMDGCVVVCAPSVMG